MEKTLTKYFWVINLVILALLAFFLSGGIGELVASNLSKVLPQTASTSPATARIARAKSLPFVEPDGTAILERNIFDSVTGPIFREGSEPPEDIVVDHVGGPIGPCTTAP